MSLSPSLCIKLNNLCDYSNGARHLLVDKSVRAISMLNSPIKAGTWIAEMHKYEITSDQISEMITFLNAIGALEIRRSFYSGIRFVCEKFSYRLFGVRLVTLTRRRPSDISGLNNSVLAAMAPLIALVFCTSLLEYGAGFSKQVFIYGNIFFVVCLWLSTLAHEQVHIKMSKNGEFQPTVLQKGLRVGILHPPLSESRQLVSALGGPLTGFMVAFLMAMVVVIVINSKLIVPSIFATLVAIFHLFSWLPNYGDGKTLVKSIRRYHATTS
ncbi:MAG: hypothetical protein QG628_845 [Patescibacteria group bacterium]|nr:hypothetical protein [Patescibacteria group bacterium]